MTYCDKVLSCLSRATDKEKETVRKELEAHIEDHRDALAEKGLNSTEALNMAEKAMGDPEVVGKALNAQFSTFWLWVKRITQGIIGFLLLLALAFFPVKPAFVTGPVDVLTCVWENWQARQGKGLKLDGGIDSEYAPYSWQCGETMWVGDDVVCLVQVDLIPFLPGNDQNCYRGYFYFYTYNEDLFAPANGEFLDQITIVPENPVALEKEYNSFGWYHYSASKEHGVQERVYEGLVMKGDAYVDVTYDHYGTYVTMRCPLTWEEGKHEKE